MFLLTGSANSPTPPPPSTCDATDPESSDSLGLLAHRYGARKSRYISSAKARLQAA